MQLKGGWEMRKEDKHFTLQFTKYFSNTSRLFSITTLWGQGIIFILKLRDLKLRACWRSELVNGEALSGFKLFAFKNILYLHFQCVQESDRWDEGVEHPRWRTHVRKGLWIVASGKGKPVQRGSSCWTVPDYGHPSSKKF